MVRAIMNGCNGRMGQVISGMVKENDAIEIVAGIDVFGEAVNGYPVFRSFDECGVEADVVIDFSSPKAFDAMMDYCVRTGTAPVVCTTGLSDEQLARLEKESSRVALLRSANMSLGVNLLIKLLKDATKTLSKAGFDIEIVEKHHKRKVDAPSGTALALAESINEAADGRYTYAYNRTDRREARPADEIGFSVVRGGTIVGEHEVIFAGEDEIIEFKHTAYSRALFAKGAVAAAIFLAGKAPGYYGMADVIDGEEN